MDELFECLTLIQTKKIERVPIVLIGSEFWNGMKDWLKQVVLDGEHNINPADLDLMPITDDLQKTVDYIDAFYNKEARLEPNF